MVSLQVPTIDFLWPVKLLAAYVTRSHSKHTHKLVAALPKQMFRLLSPFFLDRPVLLQSSSGRGATAFQRDRSLKLEAQFLRTLACRAGVLGGVSARGGGSASSSPGVAAGGVVGMEVVDDNTDDDKGGVLGKGEGGRGIVIPGGMGGAIPGHLMRRLQALSLRLVEKYVLLSQKDRALACRGLCQLWLAFSGPGQGDNLSRMVRATGTVCGTGVDGLLTSQRLTGRLGFVSYRAYITFMLSMYVLVVSVEDKAPTVGELWFPP